MKRILSLTVLSFFLGGIALAQVNLVNAGYRKALFIGAHPDDNESCAGGTMILLQQNGCEVVSVYLTSGETGIPGKSRNVREQKPSSCFTKQSNNNKTI